MTCISAIKGEREKATKGTTDIEIKELKMLLNSWKKASNKLKAIEIK